MRAPRRFIAALALLALALPAPAFAEADTFGLGDGRDGANPNLSGTINRVAPITQSITAGATTTFTIGAGAGNGAFGNTDLVMLWQPTGLTPEPTPSASPVSVGGKVGRWEFARLTSGGATSLTLAAPTLHSYDAGYAQVVRVPQYTTVTITGAVNATTWDGSKGGIIVFLANGAVTVNNNIEASGDGFRGGTKADNGDTTGCTADFGPNNAGYAKKGEGIYWDDFNGTVTDHFNGMASIANAGGGGNCLGAGGGGGGHGGARRNRRRRTRPRGGGGRHRGRRARRPAA